MIRCKPGKKTKNVYDLVALPAAGIVLVIALFMLALCGCAGEDKYVEIIIAADDAVMTPVPVLKETKITDADMAGKLQTPIPVVKMPESETKYEKNVRPEATENPISTPAITPTIAPAISPTLTHVPELTPTAAPQAAEIPNVTAVPTAAPAIPTPDAEIMLEKELDDVYIEYVEEWEKLYAEYETKCAPVLNSLHYMELDPHPEDPEYAAEMERLNAELDALAAEFAKLEEELYFEYFGKYSDVYEKYGM